MTIIEDRVIRPVYSFDLIERLRNKETLEPISRHEGERRLEEIKPSQRRKLVEHEQQSMPAALGLEFLSETTTDLVEDQSHQRLGAADVGWRYNEIERRRPIVFNEIADAPITAARHLGNNRVAIEAEERHRGRKHTGPFVLALVQ